MTEPKRILLVRLSAIGDCIHALPVVQAIRQQLPDATIGWAIEQASLVLLEGHDAVDRFHVFPRGSRGTKQFTRFVRELRAMRYEAAVDVQGLTKSGLVAKLSGAPLRVGFKGKESRELNRWLINRPVEVGDEPRHIVDRNLCLLKGLGLEQPEEVSFELPPHKVDDGFHTFLNQLRGERGLALVAPGTTWPTKIWPTTHFRALTQSLVDRGFGVGVVWGTTAERRVSSSIAAGLDGAEVMPATNLPELTAICRQCQLFVGNDSGPTHLAAAAGCPTVAVFGATDPARNGPYGLGSRSVVVDEDLDCRPCWKKHCERGDLACLEHLTVGRVVQTCEELLAGSATDQGQFRGKPR